MIPATAETASEIKARGGFYTPMELTRFMAKWAIRSDSDVVLEPSCGDGAFLSALVERFAAIGHAAPGQQLIGVEREPAEAQKARSLAPYADIRALDFFDLDPSAVQPADAAIGNPPYVRYHAFTGADRDKAIDRAQAQGVRLTGLASSWAHFVVHAAAFLKPTGRLALVLPAELLHTDYGRPVREFLLRRFRSVVVLAFDRMVFREVQVDAVVLLASSDAVTGLSVIRVRDEHSLADLDIGALVPSSDGNGPGRWSSAVDVGAGRVYGDAIAKGGAMRLGDIASVDIGFVTGADGFFVMNLGEAQHRGLPPHVLTRAVQRPRDVPGLQVRPDEISWLLTLGRGDAVEPVVRRYLDEGESRGIAERYKCRMRDPWYAVPMPRQRPDAFLPYMSNIGPRLIVNEVGARNTNLLHGVSLDPATPPARALAVAMCSSLTLLSAEIEGRAYGGGVLKLETREAERLAVPVLPAERASALLALFGEVDGRIRKGQWKSAAETVDATLGLDHQTLWESYLVFRTRRLGRRRAGRISEPSAELTEAVGSKH